MAVGNYFGRAKVNINSPLAAGECDSCGFWFPLDRLQRRMQWQGVALAWQGYLVCPKCNDKPQEQNKVLILPADPKPRMNARPGTNITPLYYGGFPPTSPLNLGFTVYELFGMGVRNLVSTKTPVKVGDGIGTSFRIGISQIGPVTTGGQTLITEQTLDPNTKAGVLAIVASLSNIPTPSNIADESLTLSPGIPTQILPVNSFRNWVLVYNPSQAPFQISLGQTTWGAPGNLQIGALESYFQAKDPVYQGSIWAVSQIYNQPIWAWDTIGSNLGNDGGVLYILYPPAQYPADPAGLPPGAVYLVPNILPSNAYAVGVVPGITPNPGAAPMIFSRVTAAQLLAAGGGNLPLKSPGQGLGQLWNDGGLVVID